MGLFIPRKANPERSKSERKEYETIIKKFMAERDLPDWFRGLSQFQMDAADALHNCIRDDSEQGTSHRVRDALIKLGIEPLVSRIKIKLAMRLSRGNDIAFLWFLMELNYRDACVDCEHKKSSGYTINEQLIMTSIAHLDMIPTLRELDKLLPTQPVKPKKQIVNKNKPARVPCILPYFQKLKRPVIYGKSLNINEGDTVANLGEYDMYLNPNYIVPNECNRWFANYELKREERIAKRIIDEEVENVFELEDAGVLSKAVVNPILCAHHDNLETVKERMINDLAVAKRRACEKYFDLNANLRHQSNKRFRDQLGKELEVAEENLSKVKKRNNLVPKIVCGIYPEKPKYEEPNKRSSTKSTGSRQKVFDEYFSKYDFGHAAPRIKKPRFFEAPAYMKPFKFNYNNIFDMVSRNPINEAVKDALDAGSDTSINHNRAVDRCCKKMWRTAVQSHMTEWAEKELVRKNQEKENLKTEEKILKFNLPYYDPNDKQLMETMLCQAICEMKKNKKFVLATFPDAHKTPVLKEWLKKRYGHVYTVEDKIESFKLSKKIFHVLKKNEISVRIPTINDVSKKRVVSYGHRDYVFRKTNYLTSRYQHNFRVTLLENTRIYWGVMRPFQCSKGPPRNEFFSYLPARENDVHMFKPWKTCEYVPTKDERLRRRKLKQKD